MITLSPLPNKNKIVPVDSTLAEGSDNLDTEIEDAVNETTLRLTRSKTYRRRSVDYSNNYGDTVSQRYRNTVSQSSFLSQASAATLPAGAGSDSSGIESLINFLADNLDIISTEKPVAKEFEELTANLLTNCHDPELLRVLKTHGWTGSRFRGIDETSLDPQSLLQALSNLYLKHKVSHYGAHISTLLETGEGKSADQIMAFVPDTLVTFLRRTGSHHSRTTSEQKLSPETSVALIDRSVVTSPRDVAGATTATAASTAASGGATGTVSGGTAVNATSASGTPVFLSKSGDTGLGSSSRKFSTSSASSEISYIAQLPVIQQTTAGQVDSSGVRRNSKPSLLKQGSSGIGTLQSMLSYNQEVKSFTFTGACMLADISGFSKFSGAKCSEGVSGLDDLREATNGFLGHIVKIVYEFGGDVIAFAGDALICVFLDSPDLIIKTETKEDTETANKTDDSNEVSSCYRALQCACVLRTHKTKFLSAHIGVSYGEMKMAMLGGHNDQWVFLLNGDCVSQLASCIEDAGSEQVAATPACLAEAQRYADTIEDEGSDDEGIPTAPPMMLQRGATMGMMKKAKGSIDLHKAAQDSDSDEDDTGSGPGGGIAGLLGGSAKRKKQPIRSTQFPNSSNYLIKSVQPRVLQSIKRLDSNGPMASQKKPKLARRGTMTSMYQHSSRNIDLGGTQAAQQLLIESSIRFVPRPVLAAVYSESLEHIGELRMVTTMFVSLDSYSAKTHSDPASLQPFFHMAQKVLHEAGGFLRQFLVDDKGCVFIAMWGMPSFTYANNSSRALFCGVSICRKAQELGHKVSTGITTGNVFCGTVGAPERCDYAGIGTDVNMAARLMSKAKGRVLVDIKTYQNLNDKTKKMLSQAEKMKLKGSDVPLVPYQYSADTVPNIDSTDEATATKAVLRRPVKALLGIQIDKVANANAKTSKARLQELKHNKVFFTIITGPPGTGKSTAVEYFRHSARKRSIACVFIQARPGHEGVPYGLMKELFLELIGEDNFSTPTQQRQQIAYLISQAYPDATEHEKGLASFSVEIVLGVEWSVGKMSMDSKKLYNISKALIELNKNKSRSRLLQTTELATLAKQNSSSLDLSPKLDKIARAGSMSEGMRSHDNSDLQFEQDVEHSTNGAAELEQNDISVLSAQSLPEQLPGRADSLTHLEDDVRAFSEFTIATAANNTQPGQNAAAVGVLGAAAGGAFTSNGAGAHGIALPPISPRIEPPAAAPTTTTAAGGVASAAVLNKDNNNNNTALSTPAKSPTTTSHSIQAAAAGSDNSSVTAVAPKSPKSGRGSFTGFFSSKKSPKNYEVSLSKKPQPPLDEKAAAAAGERAAHIAHAATASTAITESNLASDRALGVATAESFNAGATSGQEDRWADNSLEDNAVSPPAEGLSIDLGAPNKSTTSSPQADAVDMSAFGNMDYMSQVTMARPPGDLAFYKVLSVLLKNRSTAIIIEDAHFCDELSWNELQLMIQGSSLNLSVLITMRSSASTTAQPGVSSINSTMDSPLAGSQQTASPPPFSPVNSPIGTLGKHISSTGGAMSYRPNEGRRKSTLQLAISDSGKHKTPMLGGGADSAKNIGALVQADTSPANSPAVASSEASEDIGGRAGPKFQDSPAFTAIMSHENTTMIEMTGLNEAEVRELLLHALNVDSISNDLVKMVAEVSSGNAFWCKEIANFIKERGVKELEKTTQQDSPASALKVLIVMRMEKLDVDQQVVLKYASIIGDEFSDRMLANLVPQRLVADLGELLDSLAEEGFIFCLVEGDESIFAFQNQLIRDTLYELMPPRDSAALHLALAQYIEEQYSKNLRPFYPMLGMHYMKSLGKRALAFKYKVKAADQAISRGAFSDGYNFVESAATLAVTRPELKVLVDVLSRALRDLNPTGQRQTSSIGRRMSRSFNITNPFDQTAGRISAYMQLKINTEIKLEKLTVTPTKDEKGKASFRTSHSAQLNWQPSYVMSKMLDNSDDEDEAIVKEPQCCCVIQ